MPGTLLGTYVAPVSAVKIDPTPLTGWDMHRVWHYEVNLPDTHLDHPSALAMPISFNEIAGEIYWPSITTSNGHALTMPADGSTWLFEDSADPPVTFHWWGWHTSPQAFNDVATMSALKMGFDGEWIYSGWMPIEPVHGLDHMAFEWLTVIPVPPALWLFAPALVGLGVLGRRGAH